MQYHTGQACASIAVLSHILMHCIFSFILFHSSSSLGERWGLDGEGCYWRVSIRKNSCSVLIRPLVALLTSDMVVCPNAFCNCIGKESEERLLVLTSAPCRDLFSSLSLVTNLITTWGDACPASGNNMFSVTFRGNGACSLRRKVWCRMQWGANLSQERLLFCLEIHRNLT